MLGVVIADDHAIYKKFFAGLSDFSFLYFLKKPHWTFSFDHYKAEQQVKQKNPPRSPHSHTLDLHKLICNDWSH